MAIPLAPLATVALRYGVVALTAYAVARRIGPGRIDQRAEDALDEVPEGLTLQRPRDREGQLGATARWRRVVRLGLRGFEVDAAALGRVRVRKV